MCSTQCVQPNAFLPLIYRAVKSNINNQERRHGKKYDSILRFQLLENDVEPVLYPVIFGTGLKTAYGRNPLLLVPFHFF